jgi:hypothetical protein
MMKKSITISARINVALEVIAEKDEYGEVQILSIVSFRGLPTPTEIYESMDEEDLKGLEEAYDDG